MTDDHPFPAWYDRYCARTDRHTGRAAAFAWYMTGLDADDAATWARFGFTVDAASPWRAAGYQPAAAAQLATAGPLPPTGG